MGGGDGVGGGIGVWVVVGEGVGWQGHFTGAGSFSDVLHMFIPHPAAMPLLAAAGIWGRELHLPHVPSTCACPSFVRIRGRNITPHTQWRCLVRWAAPLCVPAGPTDIGGLKPRCPLLAAP